MVYAFKKDFSEKHNRLAFPFKCQVLLKPQFEILNLISKKRLVGLSCVISSLIHSLQQFDHIPSVTLSKKMTCYAITRNRIYQPRRGQAQMSMGKERYNWGHRVEIVILKCNGSCQQTLPYFFPYVRMFPSVLSIERNQ